MSRPCRSISAFTRNLIASSMMGYFPYFHRMVRGIIPIDTMGLFLLCSLCRCGRPISTTRELHMSLPLPYAVFTPFSSTTLIVPRAGARPIKVEKPPPRSLAKDRPVRPERRAPRRRANADAARCPTAARLRALCADAAGAGALRGLRGLAGAGGQASGGAKPGRIAATYALEVTAPRTARTASSAPWSAR